MVGEALAYVQGASLKANATFLMTGFLTPRPPDPLVGPITYYGGWMPSPFDTLSRERKIKAFAIAIPLGVLLAGGLISCDMSAEKKKSMQQAEALAQQQKIATEKVAQEQFVAKKRAEDEAYAAARGMTYDEYKEAEQIVEEQVWLSCRRLVEKAAVWGVDWDWGSDFEWAKNIKTNTIVLWGSDVRVKNAFNAERQASYACEYDMKTKVARLSKFE